MAGPQVSGGYAPPIGGFWGNLPVLSQINEASDLAHNPDANVAHDVTGIGSLLVPGAGGLGLGLLSSALPGGWLDSVLGLGDFSSTATPAPASGMGLDYTPGLSAALPGTGLWGGVESIGNAIGSGFNSLVSALGLGGQSSSSGDNQGIGQKFGG